MSTWASATVGLGLPLPVGLLDTPPQSPATGAVRLPSPFVSPPTVSSRHDVSTTGLAAVPVALTVPCTPR